jgi:outer membrane protein assembly factor BamB
VGRRRTTRCCSAAALLVYFCAPLAAQPAAPRPFPASSIKVAKDDHKPPPLLPVRPVWALALNNQLTAPPAYDDSHVFFSIEGDRLVAYALPSGKQAWIVSANPRMEPVTGGGLLFLVEPGALKALRAEDGSIAWELPFTEQVARFWRSARPTAISSGAAT